MSWGLLLLFDYMKIWGQQKSGYCSDLVYNIWKIGNIRD